mmetsp:Transcript_14309/g.34775  ORF Transcript_14309/g.34775 Transcript_14309/m.34775 type:complete len:216 (+) Transcript_14309:8759-9406(+)
MCQQLVRLFGGGVERRRGVGDVRLAERHLGVEAVYGGRGGEDHLRHGAGADDLFHHVDHPGHVGVDVRARVLHCVPHTRLRGEVQDMRELARVQRLTNDPAVVEVRLQCVHAARLQLRQPRTLQRLGVIVVDIVQAQHPRTHLLQRHRGVEPHEPSGSGDEHGHRAGGERRTRLLHLGDVDARGVKGGDGRGAVGRGSAVEPTAVSEGGAEEAVA